MSAYPTGARPEQVVNQVSCDTMAGHVVQAGTISGDVSTQHLHIANLHAKPAVWLAFIGVTVAVVLAIVVVVTGGPHWLAVVLVLAAAQAVAVVAARGRKQLARIAIGMVVPVGLTGSLAFPAGRDLLGQLATGVTTPEIVQVDHSTSPTLERVKVTVRNTMGKPTGLEAIEVLATFDPVNWWNTPEGETRHFTIEESLVQGPSYAGNAPRFHGSVAIDGTEFTHPLTGQGYRTKRGVWLRQLGFNTGMRLPAGADSEVTVDIPVDLSVRGKDGIDIMHFTSAPNGSYVLLVRLTTESGVADACHSVKGSNDDLRAKMCAELREFAASRPR